MAKAPRNAAPVAVVIFACVIAAIGFWRKDLDALDAMAFVGSAVTLGAGLHVRAKRKAKKAAPKPAAPNGQNGAAP